MLYMAPKGFSLRFDATLRVQPGARRWARSRGVCRARRMPCRGHLNDLVSERSGLVSRGAEAQEVGVEQLELGVVARELREIYEPRYAFPAWAVDSLESGLLESYAKLARPRNGQIGPKARVPCAFCWDFR